MILIRIQQFYRRRAQQKVPGDLIDLGKVGILNFKGFNLCINRIDCLVVNQGADIGKAAAAFKILFNFSDLCIKVQPLISGAKVIAVEFRQFLVHHTFVCLRWKRLFLFV